MKADASLSLSELTARIGAALRPAFARPLWVRAEINELRVNGGHCYMELVEKAEHGDGVVAKCRATCWANVWRMLKPYFEQATGESLRAGLQVLVAVQVEFHPVYGLSLNVCDIDPVFTVGELAARRQQILRRLEQDGVADMNRQLAVPVPALRVAVISSPTAAGYEDFCNQLHGNPAGYAFRVSLFPAVMQGDAAAPSIIAALDKVYEQCSHFDVVAIIRGGGAVTDLAAFDSYGLALNCAQFPLPIVAGIGHQRDVSILDMVAHTSVKTPTAAAEYLIANVRQAEERAERAWQGVVHAFRYRLENEARRLDRAEFRLRHVDKTRRERRAFRLQQRTDRLRAAVKMRLAQEEARLRLLEKNIESYSPAFLLSRGYTFTTLNGRRLTSRAGIRPGDRLRTYFPDGTVDSRVLPDLPASDNVNETRNHKEETK